VEGILDFYNVHHREAKSFVKLGERGDLRQVVYAITPHSLNNRAAFYRLI
jgi:hypothetical protein